MSKPIPAHIKEERLNQLHRYMAQHNLKSTRQRDLIVKTFFETLDHISIEELYENTKKLNKNIGFATVYRTMKMLCDSGLANRRNFGEGHARYENTYEGEQHDHMICTETGQILEFESDAVKAILKEIAAHKGFEIKYHKIELYGVLKKGRRKKKAA